MIDLQTPFYPIYLLEINLLDMIKKGYIIHIKFE